jgi:protein-L-isoaspartate(D-aspartate) O-methyltransferase
MSRKIMIDRHLRGRGIRDPRVLGAMEQVPRTAFVFDALIDQAYDDRPLPIGVGQTISQPYVVALMTEALKLRPTDRVLEVGTGSGYGAAVLAEIVAHVDTIERHAVLAASARRLLQRLGYGNVDVHVGDGSLGWPPGAPYQAIAVTAASPTIPPALIEQLADGGRLVIPVGDGELQDLVRVTRVGPDQVLEETLTTVRFVPLIGAQGWDEHAREAS